MSPKPNRWTATAAWPASHFWFNPGWPCWAHTRNNRVWQERSTVEIVEDVFADHAGIAAWRWDDDVPQHVANGLHSPQVARGVLRSIPRIRPGLCATPAGRRRPELARGRRRGRTPGGHTVVIFATSLNQPQDPTSGTALGGKGIRFHRSSSQKCKTAFRLWGPGATGPSWGSMGTTVLGWDYESNRAIVADVPTDHQWGGKGSQRPAKLADQLRPVADGLYSHPAQAQFAATTMQQAAKRA